MTLGNLIIIICVIIGVSFTIWRHKHPRDIDDLEED
jgi:hypothetical protein